MQNIKYIKVTQIFLESLKYKSLRHFKHIQNCTRTQAHYALELTLGVFESELRLGCERSRKPSINYLWKW